MDTNVIYLIHHYLEKKKIVDFANDTNAVMARARGKEFSFEEHLKGLIYSLLTNQRKWSEVEPKLGQVDKVFFHYDIEKIKKYPGSYFENKIRHIKCGNINIKQQMANLHDNIAVMKNIEAHYGSMDRFVLSSTPENIVRMLSDYSSKYKLKSVGPALAWEYLRNVGIDAVKPDLHMKRFMGSERMGVSKHAEATDAEILKEVDNLSLLTNYSKFEIDYLIWCYCASGKGEVCGANPKCKICVIKEYCNKFKKDSNTKDNSRAISALKKQKIKTQYSDLNKDSIAKSSAVDDSENEAVDNEMSNIKRRSTNKKVGNFPKDGMALVTKILNYMVNTFLWVVSAVLFIDAATSIFQFTKGSIIIGFCSLIFGFAANPFVKEQLKMDYEILNSKSAYGFLLLILFTIWFACISLFS